MLSTKRASPSGDFNLQRVALLLKTADILHLDETRVSSLMGHITNADGLEKKERRKYLSRSCTRGWVIDGSRIIVQAEPENTKEKTAFLQCFNWVKKNEWPAVAEGLRQYGFPYEIENRLRKRKTKKSKRRGRGMAKSTSSSKNENIRVENYRYIDEKKAHQILSMLIERKDKYPICRNQATTHAAAITAAILSVLTMLDKIHYLRNELKTRFLELLRERENNPTKLTDHIASLSESRSLLLRTIRDIPEIAGATRTFKEIPGNDYIYKDLNDINDTLSGCIDNMYEQYKQICEQIIRSKPTDAKMLKQMESEKWAKDIDQLFTQTKESLFVLCDEKILDVADSIKRIKKSIDQDWEKDIERTWEVEDHTHRPKL